MIDIQQTYVVDTYGFRVPCRSFHIRANVTRDRPLPVVDEFVLRLLRVCGQLTLQRLGDFFGFDRSETERVVRDLAAKNLIAVSDNELRLSNTALALFRASIDEDPRLIEVETWVENVWIDLVSRGFVPRPRQRANRNLVDVTASPDAVNLPADFARTAFEENFRDYVTRVRRLREPDRINIHSIAGVESDRYGSVVVVGRKVITSDSRSPKLQIDGASEDSVRFRTLVQNLSTAYGQLEHPKAQATSLLDFERISGLQLRPFLDQEQRFDVARWMRERPIFEDHSRSWVMGASYLESNIGMMVGKLKGLKPGIVSPSIRWLRPAGNGWGMTADLASALETLRRAVGLPDTPRAAGSTLFMPKAVAQLSKRRISRLFEKGMESPTRLSSSLELLVAGKSVAMLLIHAVVDHRETVPIGIVTDHPRLVARLEAQFSGDHQSIWVTSTTQGQESNAEVVTVAADLDSPEMSRLPEKRR